MRSRFGQIPEGLLLSPSFDAAFMGSGVVKTYISIPELQNSA
jgi:hypothetical protein